MTFTQWDRNHSCVDGTLMMGRGTLMMGRCLRYGDYGTRGYKIVGTRWASTWQSLIG